MTEATSPATDSNRAKGRSTQQSIRSTLRQAVDLKDLAYATALKMQGQFNDDDSADRARAHAMAITQLTKSWSEAVNVIRIERGKPLPGSLRPEGKPKNKATKAQVTLLDQDQPAA
jgi:hypothetical protein